MGAAFGRVEAGDCEDDRVMLEMVGQEMTIGKIPPARLGTPLGSTKNSESVITVKERWFMRKSVLYRKFTVDTEVTLPIY